MKRWFQRVLVILLLAAAGVWGWFRLAVPDPIPVTVYRVERGRVEETVTNSQAGTVRTRHRAKLSPEIGGRIVELPFREGDTVRQGDVLLRMDDSDLRASRDLAARDLEATAASRREICLAGDLAQREWERHQELFDEGIISADRLDRLGSERDRQDAACAAGEAAEKRAAAALEVAAARLRKSVLTAPFDGIVAEVRTEVGEFVTPTPPGVFSPPVLDLIKPGTIYVSAPLDEVDAARVHPGLPVRITLDPFRGREFYGVLTRVAPFVLDIEEQNRTFEVEAEFDDRDFGATLLPGTSADVEVILDAVDDVMRIPAYALLEGTRVLLVEGEHLVSRAVEVGHSNWEFVQVTSGLEEGEAVVVSLDRVEVVAGAPAVVERELTLD